MTYMETMQKTGIIDSIGIIGRKVGEFEICQILRLDGNTALICCTDRREEDGTTSHLEVEHWLDENTFHYNLLFDAGGEFTDSIPHSLKPSHRREFEQIFTSLDC